MFFKRFEVRCLYIIGWWLLWDIAGVLFVSESSNTAYWAHLGGFGAGVGMGWLMSQRKWVYLDKYDTTLLQMWQRRKRRRSAEATYDRAVKGRDSAPEPAPPRSEGVLRKWDLDRTDSPAKVSVSKGRLPSKNDAAEPVAREAVIRLTCSCGKRIKVPARHAGRSGRCPQCKQRIVVPKAY